MTHQENTLTPGPREFALAYARSGRVIIPLWPGRKAPHSSRRNPEAGIIQPGFKLAEVGSADPVWVEEIWSREPNAGIGVICGARSRLVIIDVDTKNAGEWAWEAQRAEWLNEGLELPSGPIVRTPSGGYHLWFGLPEGVDVRSWDGWLPGVDVLGTGHWAAVPPTFVQDKGRAYEFIESGQLALGPGWFLERITRRGRVRRGGGHHPSDHQSSDTAVDETLAGERFDWDEALTPGAIEPGRQQGTLFRAACSCRAKNLTDAQALDLLLDVVRGFTNGDADNPWQDQDAVDIWERVKEDMPAGIADLRGDVPEYRPNLTLIRGGGNESNEDASSAASDDDVTEDNEDDRPRSDGITPAPNEPLEVARYLVDRLWRYEADDERTLIFWHGTFWRWYRGAWHETEDQAIRSLVYMTLDGAIYLNENGPMPWRPNTKNVGEVISALKAETYVESSIESGSWLSGIGPDPREIIPVANGLLFRPTRTLLPHTPRLLVTSCVPFPYDPAATCDRWRSFLGELWLGGTDPELAMSMDPTAMEPLETLAEFFGYILSGRTDIHRILLLIGPSRSGKGTILRIMTALVGRESVAAPPLASLNHDFGLQPLLGKKLATFTDARIDGRTSNATIVERLLTLSGEDSITVNRKNRDQWTGRLGVRMVLVSNELPYLHDASGAVAERFLLLPPLTNSWLGREDHGLTDRLLQELPGILNWSLDGLDRLASVGRFTEPAAAQQARDDLRELGSPISLFVEERCEVGDPSFEVTTEVLYQTWMIWCAQGGIRSGDMSRFGKELSAAFPGVKKVRKRVGGTYDGGSGIGDRKMHYTGIRLIQAGFTASSGSSPMFGDQS